MQCICIYKRDNIVYYSFVFVFVIQIKAEGKLSTANKELNHFVHISKILRKTETGLISSKFTVYIVIVYNSWNLKGEDWYGTINVKMYVFCHLTVFYLYVSSEEGFFVAFV